MTFQLPGTTPLGELHNKKLFNRSHWMLAAAALAAGAAITIPIFVAVDRMDAIVPVDMAQHQPHHMMADTTGSSDSVAGRPATVVKPISCQKLPNVPGKSLTLAVIDFPPNAYTPRHRHPGSVSAFVLKGTLRSQLDGEPAGTYNTGASWFEPPGAIHLFAENASNTEPAEILAMFIADDDCGPLVIPD